MCWWMFDNKSSSYDLKGIDSVYTQCIKRPHGKYNHSYVDSWDLKDNGRNHQTIISSYSPQSPAATGLGKWDQYRAGWFLVWRQLGWARRWIPQNTVQNQVLDPIIVRVANHVYNNHSNLGIHFWVLMTFGCWLGGLTIYIICKGDIWNIETPTLRKGIFERMSIRYPRSDNNNNQQSVQSNSNFNAT